MIISDDSARRDPNSSKLIETGRFFRSSGSMRSRARLRWAIPDAHERYQMALDDLSEQIVGVPPISQAVSPNRWPERSDVVILRNATVVRVG
jgi:hypothetical protein